MAYTLMQGDCLEILPTIAVQFDVLLTDPPYGIDGGRGGQARERGKGKYSTNGVWADTREYIGDTVIPVITYALKHVKRAAITPGITNMDLYPKPADVGCFWAPAAIGRGSWGFSTFNPIFYYGKDPLAGKGALPNGIKVTERSSCSEHPCAKPLQAWVWLLRKVSLPGETVLDPFSGSGTTGVACAMEGRDFIGIELDAGYCDIARKRIEAVQPALLAEAAD